MCKYVLGVGKRMSNIATYGELGQYPLYIDTVLAIFKYWLHINKDAETDKLIKDALQDNHVMFQNKKDCWLRCLFICFVALRPKSTAMVIAKRSVHLTTLFPGQA